MSQATLSLGPYRNSNLFSGRYLDEHVYELDAWDCDEEAREAFEAISDLYETRKDALSSYDEAPLRNNWIDEVLEALGYATLPETPLVDARGSIDRTLYDTDDDQMAAAVMKADGEHTGMYGQSLSILEAKQWDADFTQQFSEQRSYRDASHQLKSYLEHTPESVSWGILTNGKKWRLYGTKDYETETYYEVDLTELLASGSVEVFKYFYVFFRPAAFRESAGTTFLDTVWSESEIVAQELGEDLQDNVFTALRVLGEGFVETNDLEIDPTDDERLAELKEQSLVLLYRLMFVLYAESRDLIDPDDPSRRSEYEENFSLGVLRHNILKEVGETPSESAFEREFSEYSFSMWNRLERVFSLVDTGNDDLGIPPYNGGLFDEESHEFLTEHEVANTYIAEVIYRLSTTETDEGFVPADYADLDTRHLGTIYEGLLEHEFAVAPEAQAAVAENGGEVWKSAEEVSVAEAVETVEKGELYVVNDDGERKATGAYYTPDYVVTYIVEETVGPLLSDIEAELAEMDMEPGTQEYVVAFWDRVTDLKILDPAMGSGHFLTKATGYLADAVMEQVRELETGRLFDEEQVRREISRECIYGVDINGMAVELAKLSMWLETLAADSPLAFLDHHLKAGNSLVGSDITEVLSSDNGGGQLTLVEAFAGTRRRALDHVMGLMSELLAIDNEDLGDIKEMETLYGEIRADPLYGNLRAMANVDTASEFGLDVPADADKQLARAIEDEDEWTDIEDTDWFSAAQAMAAAEDFFHWELEFPEVFFDMDGERMESAGFDAVVGNPPYVFISEIPEQHREYYRAVSETWDYRFDLYGLFIENGHELLKTAGEFGYIIPHSLLNNNSFSKLREFLINLCSSVDVYDFSGPVFQDASNEPMLLLTRKNNDSSEQTQLRGTLISPIELLNANISLKKYSAEALEHLPSSPFLVRGGEWIEQMLTNPSTKPLGKSVDAVQGLRTGKNTERLSDEKESGKYRKALGGEDINRYGYDWSGTYVLYDRDLLSSDSAARPREEKYWIANKKILIQEIRNVHLDRRIVACIDTEKYIGLNTTNAIIEKDDSDIDLDYVMAILSSTLVNQFFKACFVDNHIATQYLEAIPLFHPETATEHSEERMRRAWEKYEFENEVSFEDGKTAQSEELPEKIHRALSSSADRQREFVDSKSKLNLDLLDYLGTYTDGPTLGEMGYQPPSGLHESVLTQTEADTEEFETLRVTEARVERDGGDVRVSAVPYVKPTEEGAYETNSRGYATLEPVPAMEFLNVDEAQAALIEAFVPYAVEEAGGFAGYRDNATKTNSPLDRLEGLTLPKLSDVEGDIERYAEARERAAELDAKIDRTDELIDEIVYELYGLTDEEIEIVEEAVGN